MINRTKRFWGIAALLSLVLADGFHIAALQGIGYLRMFNEYSKVMPAADALQLTLSGVETCGICAVVDEIQAEMEDTLVDFERCQSALGLYLVPDTSALAMPRERTERYARFTGGPLVAFAAPPASPPPKA